MKIKKKTQKLIGKIMFVSGLVGMFYLGLSFFLSKIIWIALCLGLIVIGIKLTK